MDQGRRPLIRRSGRVWAQAVAIVSVAVLAVAAVAMAAPKGDQGPPEQAQGNGPPAAPPGQAAQGDGQAKKAPAVATRPAAPAQGQPAGHPTGGGHAKAPATGQAQPSAGVTTGGATTSGGRALAKGHADTGASRQHGSSHRSAGKATLCHGTGSSTHPHHEITVSRNAVPAQERRRGCAAGASQVGDGNGDGQSGAPSPPAGPLGRGAPGDEAPSGDSDTLGVSDDGGAGPGADGGVLGADQGGGDEGDGTFPASIASLPFTGLGLGLLVAMGTMLALAGLYVRRRAA
jgi:hypothetical protein